MEEYSYFIADIFGNMIMVDYKQFKQFLDILDHTYPDYFCETHTDKIIPHYEHRNYYHDGKLYCSILRDLEFIPFS